MDASNTLVKFRLFNQGKIVGYEIWDSNVKKWRYSITGDDFEEYKEPHSSIYIYHDAKDALTPLICKDGGEVYENDLLQMFRDEKPVFEFPCPVNWIRGGYSHMDPMENTIVIGNIRENPEMVEGFLDGD